MSADFGRESWSGGREPGPADESPALDTVKLSGIIGFWRRNRSALERRINNLGSVQGAE